MTYAVEQNKKSFLRLLQENVDELKDFSDYSLLWIPDFWKICNLNSLNKKDLLILKNKTAICLDIMKDYGPFTFQEILAVGKQCDKIQRIYVDLDSALGIDEKLKRIRQLCHESMEWDRISWNDIPVISQMLSRESLVSYRDRHGNIKGSVFEWLQLMLAEKKQPELTSMIKEAKDENDLQILVKNQDNKELLSRGLLGFKDQFIYLDPDSIWLVNKLQKEELLDALKMFCLSGGAAIAHGGLFRLVGLRPNARKNIFTVLHLEDGKQYVCDPFFLKLEKDDPYEKMIEYILHQATEQDFLDFMGYDQRPVDRKDVEEVLAQMPESEFQKLYREFGLDTLGKENL